MRFSRQFGCLAFFVALIGLLALFVWGLGFFALPEPVLVSVGQVQDYPAGQQPRLVFQKVQPFYVVNVDGEVIALAARSEDHIVRCLVHWQAFLNAFVDPCLGTQFSLKGDYRGKGPPGKLRHLPLQVKDGQLWVELGYK